MNRSQKWVKVSRERIDRIDSLINELAIWLLKSDLPKSIDEKVE